jgi:hypothetical protein
MSGIEGAVGDLAYRAGADLFDVGPYTRLQEALGRHRPLIIQPGPRALALACLAWVPLAVLALLQDHALGPTPRQSLLLDLTAYARYLVALPALLLAEPYCLPRLARIARHFEAAGLVTEADRPKYQSLLASTRELLKDRRAELGLLLFAYATALTQARTEYAVNVPTWMAPVAGNAAALSLAGWWRLLVSQPLLLILEGAWLWRIAIWARLLWKISRLDLSLVAPHPDLAGGLGFVATSLRAFMPVAFAFGAAFAGVVAEGVLVDGQTPESYAWVLAFLLVLVLLLFVSPMLVFTGPLMRLRAQGIYEYGQLAYALGRPFEQRWLPRGAKVDDEALSQQDFSAMQDLYSLTGNVFAIRPFPFQRRALVPLLVAALLPFFPLVFTVIPPKEVLKLAAKLVL